MDINDVYLDFLICYRQRRAELVNNEWWQWNSWIKRAFGRDEEYLRLMKLEINFNSEMQKWVEDYLESKKIEVGKLKLFVLSLKNNKERLMSRSVFIASYATALASFYAIKKLGVEIPNIFLAILLSITLFLLLERFQVLFRSNMYQELANILDNIA